MKPPMMDLLFFTGHQRVATCPTDFLFSFSFSSKMGIEEDSAVARL
jgi:hypothetical protein